MFAKDSLSTLLLVRNTDKELEAVYVGFLKAVLVFQNIW